MKLLPYQRWAFSIALPLNLTTTVYTPLHILFWKGTFRLLTVVILLCRATISNMSPEMGATICYFPVDTKTLDYLRLSGRSEEQIAYIEAYLKAQGLFRNYTDPSQDPVFTDVLELDLSTVIPCLSGPKRPHDYVALSNMKTDFAACLKNQVGHKGAHSRTLDGSSLVDSWF